MNTRFLTSKDGTQIAWTKQGAGPPLVMVHCVAVSRATTPQPTLPSALAEFFTVYTYDRRGTGQSENEAHYSVEREFEDLAAVMALHADDPVVYGFSSGATLALLAAESGLPIRSLALLEPPLSEEGLQNTRTIVHELEFLPGTPASRFASVETPTLLMASDHTAPMILEWAAQLEEVMPHAKRQVLSGEWHGVDDATLVNAINEYLSS